MRDVGRDIFNHDELARIKRETEDAPLSLEYRSQPSKADVDSTETTAALVGISSAGVALVVLINILGPFLLSPWLLAGFASFAVLLGLFAAVGRAGLRVAVLSLVIVTAAPLLLWPFYQATRSAAVMTTFGLLASVATSFLLDRFASHYVAWLTANHRLNPMAVQRLRAAWAKRFNPAASRQQSISRLFQVYPIFLAAPLVLTVFAYAATLPRATLFGDMRFPVIRPFAVFTSAFLLLLVVAAVVLILVRGRSTLSILLDGLRTWMNYGSEHLPAPGLFQSPAGSQLRRRLAPAQCCSYLPSSSCPHPAFSASCLKRIHSPGPTGSTVKSNLTSFNLPAVFRLVASIWPA